MPTTTEYGWPYPAGTDAGDVPFVMQQALEAVETSFANVPTRHRANLVAGASGTITATAWGTSLPSSGTSNLVLARSALCTVTLSGLVSSIAGANTTTIGRLVWTGANAGNSFDLIGNFGGAFFQGGSAAGNTFAPYNQQQIRFTHLFAAGTTTFSVEAYKGGAGTGGNINYVSLEVAPVAWGDSFVS